MPARLVLCAFITLVVQGGLFAQEDGVYELSLGNGQAIPLKIINGTIYSLDNNNEKFQAYVCFVPIGRPVGTQYYFVLDGKKMPPSYKGMTGSNDTLDLFNLTPREAASASALLGLPLQLRKNPGHRIDVTFANDKPIYAPGDPITITVTIKNIGDDPIDFECGNNGSRNDMFSFASVNIPWGNSEVIAPQYGVSEAITYIETLPAHSEFSRTENLNKWFVTNVPGHYHFIGSYVLVMFSDDHRSGPIWIDYAKGPFSFDVKTSITTLSLLYVLPLIVVLITFLARSQIPLGIKAIPQRSNVPNYCGIIATLATVASLYSYALLAHIYQPFTAMFWTIPILVARPFAFGFHIYGWRLWVRIFDPAIFTMIFLNGFLGFGMITESDHGDHIARISFGVIAVLTFLLMIYIDVFQWRRPDEMAAQIRHVVDACRNSLLWSQVHSSYNFIVGTPSKRRYPFILIVLASIAFTCCLIPAFYDIIDATPSVTIAKVIPALCVLIVAIGIFLAAYLINFSTAILGCGLERPSE